MLDGLDVSYVIAIVSKNISCNQSLGSASKYNIKRRKKMGIGMEKHININRVDIILKNKICDIEF